MTPRIFLATGAVVLVGAMFACPAFADDPLIPARCRPRDAPDNECADLLQTRFLARYAARNTRDRAANTALKMTILATPTATGETIGQTLDAAAARIPFTINGWYFVYARSGTEYVVISYDKAPDTADERQGAVSKLDLFDYDLGPDPMDTPNYNRAEGYVVWQVQAGKAEPSGYYAHMISLGGTAFTWAVNDGRKDFKDSGFDQTVEDNFAFFSKLPVGKGVVSDHINVRQAGKLSFNWNPPDGYVIQGDALSCPGTKVGIYTITGPECDAQAAAARDISGNVLPFKVIRALRSHLYVNGMVSADVSVSVTGGTPGDWLATAVYIAEHSIISDVTFSTASVFVENPWNDAPPQMVKILAKAYYAPDPSMSPWKDKWGILGANHEATIEDVEYDKLSNDLIESPDVQPDASIRLEKAAADARRVVIRKYKLPTTWQPTSDLGIDGQEHDREHIHIGSSNVDDSMSALQQCLTADDGRPVSGCTPRE